MTVPSFILRPLLEKKRKWSTNLVSGSDLRGQNGMYLNSKRYRSALAPNKHAVVSTNQPFITLVHRILKRHPALIPNGKPNGGFRIETSLATSLDAILSLRDQLASSWKGKRQGPQRDLHAAELHRRTPRDREVLKRRRVRFE